jgi:SAM-dependent methyltransferase
MSIDQIYLNGETLYGDDFTDKEIQKWFSEESEGYYNLINSAQIKMNPAIYIYHNLNIRNGFSFLPKTKNYNKVLGVGSSYGYEFLPIAGKISELIILEPSDNMISIFIGPDLKPKYLKPEITGDINYDSGTFDLVTCFGTLHHIPNVSKVLNEMIRVTAPGGFILIREPIRTMGDWTKPRIGLTKNERGIPLKYFRLFFKSNQQIEVISEKFCESLFLMKFLNKLFGLKIESKLYQIIDQKVSNLLKWNIHYHPLTNFEKMAPGSVFYVLKKKS